MILLESLKNFIELNKNLPKEELYNLCKQEILKYDEEKPLNHKEYERYINYVIEKINYFE